METIVVSYLAALSADRVQDLTPHIGKDAADATDRALYELYRRLVRRAPSLQVLSGHPDDASIQARAVKEVGTALRSPTLRAEVARLLKVAEESAGPELWSLRGDGERPAGRHVRVLTEAERAAEAGSAPPVEGAAMTALAERVAGPVPQLAPPAVPSARTRTNPLRRLIHPRRRSE